MAISLDIVAQGAMDMFYQEYKGQSEFFDISDFVRNAGNMVSEMLLQFYQEGYAEKRAERAPEVVAFPYDWLAVEELEVKDQKSILEFDVMGFPRDNNSIGIQNIVPVLPRDCKMERSNIDELWQYEYMPVNNRVFWTVKRLSAGLQIDYHCNKDLLRKVEIYYIPSVRDDMMVPDGLAAQITMGLPLRMKQVAQGTIIDTTNDGNPNKIIESEINRSAIK